MGAQVEERPDGLKVAGRGAGKMHGSEIEPHGDHRIAMAFAVAALGAEGPTTIRDADCAGVSYPTFYDDLARGHRTHRNLTNPFAVSVRIQD